MLPIIADNISGNRDDLLRSLSAVPGIYVPRCGTPGTVSRQWLKNLDEYPVHSIVLTQDTELSDLFLVEVERGCAHSCHFCLVSRAFRPLRFHSLESLVEQGKKDFNSEKESV